VQYIGLSDLCVCDSSEAIAHHEWIGAIRKKISILLSTGNPVSLMCDPHSIIPLGLVDTLTHNVLQQRREVVVSETHQTDSLEQAASLLAAARRICVSSGAGMSAESGMPTFRGEDGLWKNFRAEELATPEAFASDPLKVWEWYRWRRQKLVEIEPHDGHRVLARWEQLPGKQVTVITQNVDGLHHRAGSEDVIELHGRLDVVRCMGCPYEIASLEDFGPEPRCERCGARLRPGVVWFGESLPTEQLINAQQAIEQCDLLLVIGTSGVVYPAAGLVQVAHERQADIVEINPNATELSHLVAVCLRQGCREALLALDDYLNQSMPDT
jgi:NAD-dependent deacetylase